MQQTIKTQDFPIPTVDGSSTFHELYQIKNDFIANDFISQNDSFIFSQTKDSKETELFLFAASGSSKNLTTIVFNLSHQETPIFKKYSFNSTIKHVSCCKSPFFNEKMNSALSVVVENGSCYIIIDSIFENKAADSKTQNKTEFSTLIESKSITKSLIFENKNTKSLSLILVSNTGVLTFLSSFYDSKKPSNLLFIETTKFSPFPHSSVISCMNLLKTKQNLIYLLEIPSN